MISQLSHNICLYWARMSFQKVLLYSDKQIWNAFIRMMQVCMY